MFTIELVGAQKVISFIDGMISRILDLSPAWERIHEDFIETELELFASEGASGADGSWDGWTDSYADWREANYPWAPENIMILEGGLLDSLTGGSGHIARMGPQEAAFGSGLLTESGYGLGAVHFEGFSVKYPYGNTGAQSVDVPARKAIDPTDEDIDRWTEMVATHIFGSATT